MSNNNLNPKTVKLGQMVTACGYSDRKVYQVMSISPAGNTVNVRRMNAKLDKEASNLQHDVGGFAAHVSGTQVWILTPNPDEYVETMYWSAKLDEYAFHGMTVIDGAHEHYDYNF